MPFGLPTVTSPFLCGDKLGNLILGLAKNFSLFMVMVILCNGLHFFLKSYSQPRITSHMIVSFEISNSVYRTTLSHACFCSDYMII